MTDKQPERIKLPSMIEELLDVLKASKALQEAVDRVKRTIDRQFDHSHPEYVNERCQAVGRKTDWLLDKHGRPVGYRCV